MTKDTKIALLVALGFLIVIGILLSDHIQTTTLPTPAQLTNAGESVRTSTQTPGNGELPVKLAAPATVVPVNVVPTGGDLSRQDQWTREQAVRQQQTQPSQAQPIIHIGGPAAGSGVEQVQTASHETFAANPQTAITPAPTTPTVLTATDIQPAPNPFDPVVREAIPGTSAGPVVTQVAAPQAIDPVTARKQQIRELVGGSSPAMSPVTASPTSVAATYKAREGDTLGRMAQKALGANTKANRDAIARLNPSLQARPDVIVAGREYKIPAQAGAVAAAAAPAVANSSSTNSGSTTWYTVREGDSLWKIAKREVGDPGAVNQIIALNKESLKDGSNLQPDMKLRLPTKGDGGAVAGAND
jgi:nucleoid-associated protein YgaU